jgi:Zn-dependent protease with chaperone function
MNALQHISGEIGCYVNCVITSPIAWIIFLLAAGAIVLFLTYLFISMPANRIKIFAAGQVLIISAVWLSFTTMVCNSMVSIKIYAIYTVTMLIMMFFITKYYDKFLVQRLNASPISGLLDCAQNFVDRLGAGANVFFYDSAIPRAFASGRSIFLSIGLLELLSEEELKAVLAHESWHLMHNNKTHWLKQLSMMTFMPTIQSDLERMADQYASSMVGHDALNSARSKLFPDFNSR